MTLASSHSIPPPGLSVIVALISGRKDDLRQCLQGLYAQTLPPTEILVPYDPPCAAVVTLQDEFPRVQFLAVKDLESGLGRAGASREHHDTLRTVGIRAAAGALIALTEDHEHVDPTWCAELAATLQRHPGAGAVGGAVECDSHRALNWAVWFCDFSRYQRPLPEGRAEYVSDSNVLYPRAALETVARTWKVDDYHEPTVHQALVDSGFELCTTPRAVAWQARHQLGLGTALRERRVWGRSYAGTRTRLIGARRWVYAAASPLLPPVLTWRIARTTWRRGRHVRRFIACAPLVVLLTTAWMVGECVGYLTARP